MRDCRGRPIHVSRYEHERVPEHLMRRRSRGRVRWAITVPSATFFCNYIVTNPELPPSGFYINMFMNRA
jgi:hypothetical protein